MGFVQRYQKRISGPLMDRIDIHLDVMRVPFEKLSSLDGGEPSSAIRARVEAARAVQARALCTAGQAPRPGQRRHGTGRGTALLPGR